MTRVLLVRHACHGLLGKVLAGRTPGVPLSDEGHAQAAGLARALGGATVGTLLSSPMERCRQTAAPLAARLELKVEIREELNELDCGAWTGKAFADLAGEPRWHAWNQDREHNGIPDGETAGQVLQRVAPLLERAGATAQPTSIWVTHSDVIKMIVMALLGLSPNRHDRLEIGPASVTTLDLWPGGGKLVRSNQDVLS